MSELLTKCEACGSLVDEEELFCANCGLEAPQREESTGRDSSRLATHNFECSGCGASMSYDASAGSLRCPFCASVDMVKKNDAKILSPSRVVPFAITKEQVIANMRHWLSRGWFRPSKLSQLAAVVRMTPVYVPYWIFEAKTHTYWTADTDRTPAGARGDWFPLSGQHRGSYSNLLIGASGALSPAETSKICPFDLSTGQPPDQIDLDNVTVEQFSVPRKYARPLARNGLDILEAQACDAKYVPGRSRNVKANVRIEQLSSEPVLLPVWIMAYRFQDRVYRFVANGQTGRATGEAPTSWKKILMLIALAILVLFLVLGVLASAGAAMDHSGVQESISRLSPAIQGTLTPERW